MNIVTGQYAADVPYGPLDEERHQGDAGAGGRDEKHLDELPLPLEVLPHHQGRCVPGHPDADALVAFFPVVIIV